MKKNKGFTLIELLAVILILAVIAMIATPIILENIETSKSKAAETSVEGILRAADNYYYRSKINKDVTYPKELKFPAAYDELKLKGDMPDSGTIIIYADGKVSLDVLFGDDLYSKYKEERKIVKNRKVVESDSLWSTSGTGILIAYNGEINIEEQLANIEKQFNYFIRYLIVSMQYATNNGLGTTNISPLTEIINNATTLEEVILQAESILDINRTGLPQSLNDELDKIIDNYLNVKSDYNGTIAILSSKTDIPHTLDALSKFINNNDDFGDYSASYEIMLSYKLTIPNYVEHENGRLEKINEIGDGDKPLKQGIILGNVSISNGIKKINNNAFWGSVVTNVTIPNSVEQIGDYAFYSSSIQELKIPGSVKKIGRGCFYGNNIKTLTLSEGLEEIEDNAFNSNDIETLKLPLSLKKVGYSAFANNPLKKVYKYKNANYSSQTNSFGNVGAVPFEDID